MKRFAAALVALAISSPLAALAQVTVSDPWVRGTVPGQGATGAFMKLASRSDVSLVAAESPAAEIIEIHEMRLDGGVMRMRAVERLPIEAGKTVELKPNGLHLMLMALTRPMKAGEAVPLKLTFEDRSGRRVVVDVKAPVRALTAGGHESTK
jgi:copper(I)-binding protein